MMTSRYSRTRKTQVARVPSRFIESTERIAEDMREDGYPDTSNVDVMEELSFLIEREVGRIKKDLKVLMKEPNGYWKKRR